MLANVFDALPVPGADEAFDVLLSRTGLKIERIVSHGHASPPGFWYDEPQGEWLIVVAGAARLRFEDEPEARALRPGDCVDIDAHRRHRVEWTDPAAATIWIAVHYGGATT